MIEQRTRRDRLSQEVEEDEAAEEEGSHCPALSAKLCFALTESQPIGVKVNPDGAKK